ncbi:MAG: ThiF family adenylyltransferase [Spirochaetaceae bacterium]
MKYFDLFKRNLGVFNKDEQQSLRTKRVVIIGTGGIGGIAANIFARSGVENFLLSDFDFYEVSNINRQINANVNTLNENKAENTAKALLDINPNIKCKVISKKMSFSEIKQELIKSDFIFPAADDFAFSLTLFRIAKDLGKPGLVVVPSGLWARIAVISAEYSRVESLFGLPYIKAETYDELYHKLKEIMSAKLYKYGANFYKTIGGWQKDYFEMFIKEEVPPTQICPLVWAASSVGVLESIKYLTNRKSALILPKFIEFSSSKIRQRNLYFPSLTTLRILKSKLLLSMYRLKRGNN